MNKMESALSNIYDQWEAGIRYERTANYSMMFRMGVPDDYMEQGKYRILYYGQECLRMTSEKTPEWIIKYQTVQRTETQIPEFQEWPNNSPFWQFYRALFTTHENATVLWGNLNKIHCVDPNNKDSSPKDNNGQPQTSKEPITDCGIIKELNAQYGPDSRSIIQREIDILEPNLVVFAIGPKYRYITALASAFGIRSEDISSLKPTKNSPAKRINDSLQISIPVIWTYHPAYLSRIQKAEFVVNMIKQF